jgi:hypothetical protein
MIRNSQRSTRGLRTVVSSGAVWTGIAPCSPSFRIHLEAALAYHDSPSPPEPFYDAGPEISVFARSQLSHSLWLLGRIPLVESCAICFVDGPLLPITNLPASNGSVALASCWNCGSSLLFCDPENSASSMVVEIMCLESAIRRWWL